MSPLPFRGPSFVSLGGGGVSDFWWVPLPHRVGLKTQPESKCPELLANYCDMLLRKTPLSKKLTSEEIELKLKEVVSPDPAACVVVMSCSWTIQGERAVDSYLLFVDPSQVHIPLFTCVLV